jgi:hypothetical protein
VFKENIDIARDSSIEVVFFTGHFASLAEKRREFQVNTKRI